MELLARRAAVLAALVGAAACYSPQIDECTIHCGSGGSCPSGTTCLDDDFCHGSQATLCGTMPDAPRDMPDSPRATPDSPVNAPDARRSDAPVGTPDAPIGTPDSPVATPDAPPPPPDAPPACVPILEPVDVIGAPQLGDVSLGPDGILHATYIRNASHELWYAEKAPGQDWTLEMVDDASSLKKGQFLDPFGGLHVAYTGRDKQLTLLRYAHHDAQGWTTETVTSDGDAIDATIAVDMLGTVHIAYYDQDAKLLGYAARSIIAADWSFDTIDDDGDVGEYPSLAIDPTNERLFVTYHDVSQDQLKLAQRVNLQWMPKTVDANVGVGAWTALAIDSSGNLHIAYADETAGNLRYMLIDHSGGEPLRLPADGSNTGQWNAIGVDPAGGVHISTSAFGAGALDLAYRPPNGAFRAAPVDSGKVGRFTGIAVDAHGGSHIVYTDDQNGALKHAFVCPPPILATPLPVP